MTRKLWAGLDVGVETTAICVIDDSGGVLQEVTCASRVETVDRELRWLRRRRLARVAVEATNSASLARGLRSRGYLVDLFETRRLSKFLSARRNKTDANDARGIAEAGRIGTSLVPRVHLKSLECQALQSRLVIRRHLIRQRVAAVNLLCRQLELYGGRVSRSTLHVGHFRQAVEAEIVLLFGRAANPLTSDLRRLLDHCCKLRCEQQELDRELSSVAQANAVCRRLMEIPGIGPICALSFYAAVEEPHRFRRADDIGAYFGLTPRIRQSGLTGSKGRLSRMGNKEIRSLLAQASIRFMQCSAGGSPVRRWASAIEQRRGKAKARLALARKLSVIMLALWKKDESYRPEHGTASEQPSGPDAQSNPDCTSMPTSTHGLLGSTSIKAV